MVDKKVKLKAKITFEWTYLASPQDYVRGDESIENLNIDKMIEMDKAGANDDLYLFLESCNKDPIVKIIEEKEEKI